MNDTPDTLLTLENHRQRLSRLRILFFVELGLSLVVFLFVCLSGFLLSHPIFCTIVCIWITAFPIFFSVIHDLDYRKHRKTADQLDRTELGLFTTELLQRTIDDAFSAYESPSKRRPPLFFLPSASGYRTVACCLRSRFVPFVLGWNALFISTDYLRLLTPEELKTLIGHELAHFHRLPCVVTEYYFSTVFCQIACVLGVFATLPWDEKLAVIYLIAMPFVSYVFKWLILVPQNRTVHDTELLADLESSRHFGKFATINQLLKLHEYGDTLNESMEMAEMIIGECSTNSRILPQPLEAGDLPSGPFRREELFARVVASLKRQGPALGIDEEEIDEVKNEAWKCYLDSKNSEQSSDPKLRETFPIQWRKFDSVLCDGRLDRRELGSLVAALMTHPKAKLIGYFDSPFAGGGPGAIDHAHPSLRERVLFLAKSECFTSAQNASTVN